MSEEETTADEPTWPQGADYDPREDAGPARPEDALAGEAKTVTKADLVEQIEALGGTAPSNAKKAELEDLLVELRNNPPTGE